MIIPECSRRTGRRRIEKGLLHGMQAPFFFQVLRWL